MWTDRTAGTDSTTITETITVPNYVPYSTICYTTWGVPMVTVAGIPVVTISVYTDASTTITLTPNAITYTLYPTSTYILTSTIVESETAVVVSTQTMTEYSTATATEHSHYKCNPVQHNLVENDVLENDKHQDAQQLDGLPHHVIAIYIVGITIGWSLFFVRHLLYPLKSLIVAIHELGHILGFLISREPIQRITIDPTTGGGTFVAPGVPHAPIALYLGIVFSVVSGGVFTFCGFDELASKIASFIVGLALLPVLVMQADLLGQVSIAAAEGLMIGLWFLEHGQGLRYFILFIGVMNSVYVLCDTMDDYLHRKQNACCVIVIHSHTGQAPTVIFTGWLVASFVVLIAFVIAALATWRETPHGMYCQSQLFLPT
ncbi:hypothetical protein RQP46_011037 [Phenoliferia psychrophenolica]